MGIFEVLTITPEINKLILQRATAADIQNQAVKEGMITMRQDGFIKALSGYTTLKKCQTDNRITIIMTIQELLNFAVQRKASDLHIIPGYSPDHPGQPRNVSNEFIPNS